MILVPRCPEKYSYINKYFMVAVVKTYTYMVVYFWYVCP